MDEERRLAAVFRTLSPIVSPAMKCLLGYSFEPVTAVKGPVLLLCNHNTDFDCVLLGMAARRGIHFVATENVARMGLLGKAAMYFCSPILHYKGRQGILTTKAILGHIRNGNSVAMFPEGNRSFNGRTCPIPPATGKLARSCGATLVTYRIRGGYFTTPRWGKGIRKGKMHGGPVGIYSHEQLAAMSPAEVNGIIARDLQVDAYEDQQNAPVAYRSKAPAEALESTLFLCPSCGKIGGLQSRKDRFFCSCGFTSTVDARGYVCSGGSRRTVTELDSAQRQYMEELQKKGTGLLFSDRVTLQCIGKDHSLLRSEEGELRAYPDRLEFGSLALGLDRIDGIAINQRNLLLVNSADAEEQYEFRGSVSFNALKYLYLQRAAFGSRTGTL